MSAPLPVNAMSREAVDAEVGRLRHSVIPIIRSKGGQPFLDGSAVAIAYRSRKCLATAFHVLKHNEGRQLMYFAATAMFDRSARRLRCRNEVEDLGAAQVARRRGGPRAERRPHRQPAGQSATPARGSVLSASGTRSGPASASDRCPHGTRRRRWLGRSRRRR